MGVKSFPGTGVFPSWTEPLSLSMIKIPWPVLEFGGTNGLAWTFPTVHERELLLRQNSTGVTHSLTRVVCTAWVKVRQWFRAQVLIHSQGHQPG